MAKNSAFSLSNLLNISKWQEIQDNFSAITDVNLRTLGHDSKQFTRQSKHLTLCNEIITHGYLRERICDSCLPSFLGGRGVVDKNLSYSCELGICNFATPVRIMDKPIGYIIAGPVFLIKRKTKEEYRYLAEELNTDLEKLWSALLEIKTISFHGIKSLLELITDIATYTIELSYKNAVQEKATLLMNAEKFKQFCDALLDVAFTITHADTGSIMFLDKDSDELTIKSFRGIENDIALNSRVRLGNGVSGIAAENDESFLIDDSVQDTRIKPFLKRPEIASSLVLPVKAKDDVVGVLNLGASRFSPTRFNQNNLKEVNRLIELASIAIE